VPYIFSQDLGVPNSRAAPGSRHSIMPLTLRCHLHYSGVPRN